MLAQATLALVSTIVANSAWAQTELSVFEDPDGAVGFEFATRVAVDGDWAAVRDKLGHVRMYQFTAGAWIDEGRIEHPSGLAATFGTRGDVDLMSNGNQGTLVVGQLGYVAPGTFFSGSGVHLYDFDGASGWVYHSWVAPAGGGQSRDFGASVAIGGSFTNQKIACAHVGSDSNSWSSNSGVIGSVQVWSRNTILGAGLASHEASFSGDSLAQPLGGGFKGTAYGKSIDLSDDVLVVGEPEGGGSLAASGVVHVYRHQAGNWTAEQEIKASGEQDDFGSSVAVDGGRLIVASPRVFPDVTSRAVIYEFNGTFWASNGSLTLPPNSSIYEVDISGDLAALGSTSNQSPFLRVTVLERFGTWTVNSASGGSAANGSSFGRAVALDGNALIVGANQATSFVHGADAGSAHFFYAERTPDCDGNGVPDTVDINLGTHLDLDADGELDICGGLQGAPVSIQTFFGGAQNFALDAGAAGSGDLYILVGSFSGALPGVPLSNGDTLPVSYFAADGTPDPLTQLGLFSDPTFYVDNVGVLDGAGMGSCAFVVPQFVGQTVPSGVTLVATHAFLAIDLVTFNIDYVSNPVQVSLSLF